MAIEDKTIEPRFPLKKCFDVLLQHLITCAIGGGIEKQSFYTNVKSTVCFADLTVEEYEECLDFLTTGGRSFNAYSEYKKLVSREDGFLVVTDPQIIRRHKMNIGTITSDSYVAIKMLKGKSLGTIEESFISQLKNGDNFLFAGKQLKLVQFYDLTAYVRLTKETQTQTAVWSGSGLPFSAPLGIYLRKSMDDSAHQVENALLKDLFKIQNAKSYVPGENELLIEIIKSREGWHLFFFPFDGKTTHEALALLVAHRLSNGNPSTLVISCNDYGFELLSKNPYNEKMLTSDLFDGTDCRQEVEKLINLVEASKAAFRDIARISGLVFQGFPGKQKSSRQLQMSTSLFFDVLKKYDTENLLLKQAQKETLDKYFAHNRLINTLKRLKTSQLVIKHPLRFTPFSLPLFVERVSQRLSTETLAERIKHIQNSWVKKL